MLPVTRDFSVVEATETRPKRRKINLICLQLCTFPMVDASSSGISSHLILLTLTYTLGGAQCKKGLNNLLLTQQGKEANNEQIVVEKPLK